LVVEVWNRPTFWMVLVVVYTPEARVNANCTVLEAMVVGVTAQRAPATSVISPFREVSVAPGAVPVPRAA